MQEVDSVVSATLSSDSDPNYMYNGANLVDMYSNELVVSGIYVRVYNTMTSWKMDTERCKLFVIR